MIYCNPETGVCSLSKHEQSSGSYNPLTKAILYFGDPMCSWCWGLAPEIDKLADYFSDSLNFKLFMGGLRTVDNTPWNSQMKNYLRSHWEQVHSKTGQPFSYELLKRDHFTYNTEPACRAVKVAGDDNEDRALSFYHKVQHRFYVENEDPNRIEFYKPVCRETGIPFDSFKSKFQSDRYRKKTEKDFQLARQLGVTAFPTVLLAVEGNLAVLSRGYAPFELMKIRTEEQLNKTTINTQNE